MKTILAWVTGPFTKLATVYMESKARYNDAALEREVKRDFMHRELTELAMDDDYKRTAMIASIIRNDRGDWKTSWIRPLTAGMALVFWLALCLSQIELGGNGILPIIWHVPPGLLGQAFLSFPMGVLATFFLARPFEKFLIGRKT